MNKNLEKLHAISDKEERLIIGLMSGTSLDGLDVALCKFSGNGFNTKVEVLRFETVEYSLEQRKALSEVCFKETVSLKGVTLLNKKIAIWFTEIILSLLKKWNYKTDDIDLIASHGQTIYHAPTSQLTDDVIGNCTLQIGDGDYIAHNTGIITISDFRQKNIAAGGQGAPLAVYSDLLLFSYNDADVVLLNIGGIANITYLPADKKKKILCTDVGPGNTLMNFWASKYADDLSFDVDSKIALRGTVHEPLLNALLADEFFTAPLPKTTGPEYFNEAYLLNALASVNKEKISKEDVMATLNRFTALAICNSITSVVEGLNCKIYVSGGGLYNPLLLQHLKHGLPYFSFHKTEEKGIPSDAKEAVLFALLANETIFGDPHIFSNKYPEIISVGMGKMSFLY